MIVLFNPRSTTPGKQPLPLSVLSLAAVLAGRHRWALVDGNLTNDPAGDIAALLSSASPGDVTLLGVTVMPGPQLSEAVPICRDIRARMPHVPIVWGGYFPTQHADTVLASSFVDFVIRSQGEQPLLGLIEEIQKSGMWNAGLGMRTPGLSWKDETGRVTHNQVGPMIALDDLPDLPYMRVDMERYLQPTYLGRRTAAHNSSFGCPFACSFCAVVAMTNRRWLAQSPPRMERVLRHLVDTYRVDAVQMHDMDFFISEARVAEFAERIAPLGIRWWALGRVDTLMQYSDATWDAMARSGLKMLFSGAESASDATLAAMNKGGKSSARQPLELARRMKHYGVVPEFSFVLGAPPDPIGDMEKTFDFIRTIKRVNPATEVILYTYTPVPMDGTLYAEASRLGFAFPKTLDEWASDEWRQLMMRRGDGIPWLDGSIRRQVRNFERVLNAFYPTVTDRRMTAVRRAVLKAASAWRYALKVYSAPLELQALQRVMQYQRPETTGF
jgi:anaerobic magnesium-protoporphyrin IX monomethyl ester cyclase